MERVDKVDGLRGKLAALAVPSTDAAPIDEARFTLLNLEGRAFADRVLARLQEMETFERKQQKLANIIQMQARHLAMFLRREREYKPFVAKW
jgi:CRISPR/Cas system-associated endonuclease Cas1